MTNQNSSKRDSATANEPTPEPLIDLQRLLASIRRRRRMWLSLTMIGLLAGMALAVVAPSPPTAVTRLLIVHENDQPSDGGSLMQTDIALLETTKIAGAALRRLHSDEPPARFLNSYEANGLTSNVMELKVTGSSNRDAVNRAKALSDAFLADYVRRIKQAAEAETRALLDQQAQVKRDLARVDRSIEAAGASGGSAAELESLYGRRAELSSQISDLGNRAEDAGVGTPSVAAGTEVADAPHVENTSLLKTGLMNGALGAVAGLAVGLALAAVGAVTRDRPALRRDISAHLGASVIAQLPAPPHGPARLWRRSRAVAETKRAAATLVRTVPDAPAEVSLLELGCPRLTATLAIEMALELAERGPVAVIDALPGQYLHDSGIEPDGSIRVVDSSEFGIKPSGQIKPGERHIGVSTVEPGATWTDLGQLGPETILVVRAGYADTAWLHTVARQLADARIPVIGIVLVDPDPKDRSDGTLWDGLQTALRGRSVAATDDESERPSISDRTTRRLKPVAPDGGNGATRPAQRPAPAESTTERLGPAGKSRSVEVK